MDINLDHILEIHFSLNVSLLENATEKLASIMQK